MKSNAKTNKKSVTETGRSYSFFNKSWKSCLSLFVALFILSSSFPIGPIVSFAATVNRFQVHVKDGDSINVAGVTVSLFDKSDLSTHYMDTDGTGTANFPGVLDDSHSYIINVSKAAYSSFSTDISISEGEMYEVTLIKQFTVTTSVSPTAGGSITPTQTVGKGSSPDVTITANSGFVISSLTDSGAAISDAVNQNSHMIALTNIAANHTIIATFAESTNKITVLKTGNGQITVAGTGNAALTEEIVPRGGSISFIIAADAGNQIKSITVNGTPITEPDSHLVKNTDGSYTFTFSAVTAPQIFAVEFEQTFNITVASPTDGKITVNGPTVLAGATESVAINGNIAFTMTPNEGHLLKSILVGSTTILAGDPILVDNKDGSYTYNFNNVTGPHSISAVFEDQKFNITVTSSTSGIITVNGTTHTAGTTESVTYNQNISFTVKPYHGYNFEGLLVDTTTTIHEGDSRIEKNGNYYTYTFSNVKVQHSIAAVYDVQKFNITTESTANGKIFIEGTTDIAKATETVTFNDEISFKMIPDIGYLLDSLLVDGKTVAEGATGLVKNADGSFIYTFTDVQDNHSIKASFTIQQFNIAITGATNGSITVNGTSTPANTNQQVNYGSDISLTFTPDSTYALVSIKLDDVECLSDDIIVTDNLDGSFVLTIKNVQGSHSVAAVFEKIQLLTVDEIATYTITPTVAAAQDLLLDGTRVYIYQPGTTVTFTPVNTSAPTPSNTKIALNPVYFRQYSTSASVTSSTLITSIYFRLSKFNYFSMNMDPIQIIIDGTNPQIDTIITKTPDSVWTNGSVLVEGTATDTDVTDTDGKGLDGAGLAYIYFSSDKAVADADAYSSDKTSVSTANLTPTGAFSFTVPGTTDFSGKYYVWAYDRSYNKSAVQSVDVNIETVKPTINTIKSTQTTPWTNQAVTVDITAEDVGGSGMSDVRFSTDEALANNDTVSKSVTGVGTADLKGGIYSFTVPNSANFEVPYYIWAYDQAGNKSIVGKIDTIRIDIVKPVVTSVTKNPDPASGWSTGAVTISAVCSDDKSGIERVVCSPHSSFDIEYPMVSADGITYTYTTDGSEYNAKYYVRVYDNATNDSSNSVDNMDKSIAISIDTKDPVITNFEIIKTDMSVPARIINFLTFGTFFNSSVKVTVTAADADISSGLVKITLNLLAADGSVISTIDSTSLTDNKFTFTISPESAGKLSASVVDKSGRISAATSPSQVSGGITNDSLILSTTAPVIQITPDAGVFTDANNRVWYAGDAGFAVLITDDYGIKTVTASINGAPLTSDIKGKSITSDFSLTQTFSQSFVLNTSQGAMATDGHYTIDVLVTDVNGNVTSSSSTVYKDVTDPAITGFVFSPADGISIDGALVEATDYGYYFVKDTVATISSVDSSPSSGIKSITYYTVDCSSSAAGVQSQEKTVIVGSSNSISITIPANFKGQIYAKANDQVGNISDSFAKPNGAVVEDAGQHAATSAISLSVPETPYKDNDGLALYQNNVSVDVIVGDSYSGIKQIEWSVVAAYDTANNQNGSVNIDNAGAVTGDTVWNSSKKDANLVTEMTRTITVANNSNAVRIYVRLTDRAGNISEQSIFLSIDKTQPTIQITYNNNSYNAAFAGEAQYYKADRTATIVVTERNFDASKVAVAITNTDAAIPGLSSWTEAKNTADPDMTTHTATITYNADGDYTFDLDLSDRAGLKNTDLTVHKFTIDKTIPTVQVSYDNTSSQNGSYYNKERTATITIKEHNFETGSIVITGTASNDGSPSAFPQVSSWSTSGDTHTATIKYSSDALYSFDISYTDKALNATEDFAAHSFYVDLTAPAIAITGVKDKSANNGDVIPVITFTDVNFDKDSVTVTLSGANRGNVTTDGKYSTIKNGEIYTFANFEKVKNIDDLYTLTANITDTAGNITTKVIVFSVNRFGSVYVFDNTLKNIEGKYVQNGINVVLTETNVDELEAKNTNLKITKNGESRDLVEGTDYTITHNGGDGQWNQYTYVLGAALFSDDGKYIVTLYSKDMAGNINENIDESKKAEIWFGVDKTLPVILATDLSDNSTYALNSKTVSSNVSDNLVLQSVQIFLNGQEIKYTVENDKYTFEIPSSNNSQTIKILATDSAGNVSTQEIKNFYVTTNLFVRWYTNTPLFVGSIAAFVLIIGALVYIFIYPRPRRRTRK